MTNRADAKFLQVLRRQVRENRLVYVILAECRFILPEAQAPQPDHNVHNGAHNQRTYNHLLGKRGCPGWLGVLRASQSPLRSGRSLTSHRNKSGSVGVHLKSGYPGQRTGLR